MPCSKSTIYRLERYTIMGKLSEIRIPNYPECWETCGNCANGEISIAEVLVAPGDQVKYDDVLIVLETGKVALDIPSPNAGTVISLHVAPGERVEEGQLILVLER